MKIVRVIVIKKKWLNYYINRRWPIGVSLLDQLFAHILSWLGFDFWVSSLLGVYKYICKYSMN